MDLEIIVLSEASQTKTNIIHMMSLIYVESKENDRNELIYKTETNSQSLKPDIRLPKGKCWGKG